MKFDAQAFGLRVRKLRLHAGITQARLAEKVGISLSFLGHIERGTRAASLDTLFALAEALNVAPDYLLTGLLGADTLKLNERQVQALRELTGDERLNNWLE